MQTGLPSGTVFRIIDRFVTRFAYAQVISMLRIASRKRLQLSCVSAGGLFFTELLSS